MSARAFRRQKNYMEMIYARPCSKTWYPYHKLFSLKDLIACLRGIKAFRATTREYRKQFPKRKGQRKTDENKTEENEECTNQFELEEDDIESENSENADSLMEELQELRKEVEMLRKQLKRREESEDHEIPDAKKAKTDEIETYCVMAYWANDGNMFEAIVLNIETVCSVQYVLDKMKKKL